jgi:hypothetical protein
MLLQRYQHFNNPKLKAASMQKYAKSGRLALIFSAESSEGGE